MLMVLGGAAGLIGVALALWGVFGPSPRRLGVRAGTERCARCGYPLEGLEDGYCPECGGEFEATTARMARRWRMRVLGAGAASIGLSLLCWPLADASRFGVAHALPNIAIVEWLRVSPRVHGSLVGELQTRVDSGALRAWERRELSRVCAGILGREAEASLRRDAAWLLAHLGADAPRKSLGAMLRDRDAAVRAYGVEATRRSGVMDGAARDALPELVLSDRSALVRRRAIDAMRAMSEDYGLDGGRMRSTILLALDDPNDGVRVSALSALGDVDDGNEETLRAVCRKASDPSEDVRWSATAMLGRIHGAHPEALAALAGSLDDQSPIVRAGAAGALGRLAGMGTARDRGWMLPRLLASALGDSDDYVRQVAMEALRGVLG
jgi:hypothetical protein